MPAANFKEGKNEAEEKVEEEAEGPRSRRLIGTNMKTIALGVGALGALGALGARLYKPLSMPECVARFSFTSEEVSALEVANYIKKARQRNRVVRCIEHLSGSSIDVMADLKAKITALDAAKIWSTLFENPNILTLIVAHLDGFDQLLPEISTGNKKAALLSGINKLIKQHDAGLATELASLPKAHPLILSSADKTVATFAKQVHDYAKQKTLTLEKLKRAHVCFDGSCPDSTELTNIQSELGKSDQPPATASDLQVLVDTVLGKRSSPVSEEKVLGLSRRIEQLDRIRKAHPEQIWRTHLPALFEDMTRTNLRKMVSREETDLQLRLNDLQEHGRRTKLEIFVASPAGVESRKRRLQALYNRLREGRRKYHVVADFDFARHKQRDSWAVIQYIKARHYDEAVIAWLNSCPSCDFKQFLEEFDPFDLDFSEAVASQDAEAVLKTKIVALDANKMWSALKDRNERDAADALGLTLTHLDLFDQQLPVVRAGRKKTALLSEINELIEQNDTNLGNGLCDLLLITTDFGGAHKRTIDSYNKELRQISRLRDMFSKGEMKLHLPALSKDVTAKKLKQLTLDAAVTVRNMLKTKKPNFIKMTAIVDCLIIIFRTGGVSKRDAKQHMDSLMTVLLKEIQKESSITLDMLEEALNRRPPHGTDIVNQCNIFSEHVFEQRARKTAGMTFSKSLKELVRLNPGLSNAQQHLLKTGYRQYNSELSYLLFDPKTRLSADEIRRQLKSKLRKHRGNCRFQKIPEILAAIAAVLALDFRNDMSKVERIKDRMLIPHPVQVLVLFRLLKVDSAPSASAITSPVVALDNHLIQLGTGEGKSLVLGILAIFLALHGVEVDIVCYSKHLSERDDSFFLETMKGFGVQEHIHYCTFPELSKRNIIRNGDVIKGTKLLLDGHLTPGNITRAQLDREQVLLIDEVDVFFSEDFYGASYRPAVLLQSEAVLDCLKVMWRNRADLKTLKGSTQYVARGGVRSHAVACMLTHLDSLLLCQLRIMSPGIFVCWKNLIEKLGWMPRNLSTRIFSKCGTPWRHLKTMLTWLEPGKLALRNTEV